MFLSCALLILAQWLTPAAATVHTGFACGAFWSQSQAKTKEDFVRQFNLAKNLPDVPVSFNSARLFQTAQWQTQNDPSEAFEAAIETNTTLLLGIWVSASDNELIALDHAFEKHGQKLADLVVGISVGNEDIYRTSDMCTQKNGGKPCDMAYSADEIKANISSVRSTIAQKPWIKLFKEPPPIGHTDIAQYAPLEGSDFIGMTAYPVWNKDSIENANESFFNSLAGVQERSGNTPVWITETGWPSSGSGADISPPSLESMQEYWTKVGCSLFGKYNVWWFELERDTDDGLDWGIIDIPSQTPKIKDLSCPGFSNPGNSTPPSSQALSPAPAPGNTLPSTFTTLPSPAPSTNPISSLPSFVLLHPSSSLSSSAPALGTSVPTSPSTPKNASTLHITTTPIPAAPSSLPPNGATVHITTTVHVTVPPTPVIANLPAPNTTTAASAACVTVADISCNGHYVPVATNPAGPDGKCASPPAYTDCTATTRANATAHAPASTPAAPTPQPIGMTSNVPVILPSSQTSLASPSAPAAAASPTKACPASQTGGSALAPAAPSTPLAGFTLAPSVAAPGGPSS